MVSTPPRTTAWRIFAIPAVLAIAGYILLYSVDSHLRTRRGPWEVTFLADPDGTPALEIAEPALGIRGVTVRFVGEQLESSHVPLPSTVRFDAPLKTTPFGEVAFDDLMYQPGTVVLHCFGHEVQMLPRGLFLNRRERPWSATAHIELRSGDKLPDLGPPAAKTGTGRVPSAGKPPGASTPPGTVH